MIRPFVNNETDFIGTGKIATATKEATTDIDLLVAERRLINGGIIYFDKCAIGDSFTCQIVDVDGVYAEEGTVLNEWMKDWPAMPGAHTDLVTEQAGDIPPGVYLRIKYTSIGTIDDVKVLIGYRLYKVLS